MSEKELLNDVLLNLSRDNVRLFRNNVGVGWQGRILRPTKTMTVKVGPGDIVLRHARPIHAGLVVGSSDLIGWTTVKILPSMVGGQVAVFSALEAKTPGVAVTEEQQRFIQAVNQAGGRAGVIQSVQDAIEVVCGF